MKSSKQIASDLIYLWKNNFKNEELLEMALAKAIDIAREEGRLLSKTNNPENKLK